MKTTVTILLIFLLTPQINSQPGINANFMPLQVGNVWVYFSNNDLNLPSKYKIEITETEIINGKTFYKFSRTGNGTYNCSLPWRTNTPAPSTGYILVDSLARFKTLVNGSGCNYYAPNEMMIDSFSSRLFDTSYSFCNQTTVCFDTSFTSLFGISRKVKKFSYNGGISYGAGEEFANGIGIYLFSVIAGLYSCYSRLQGCVINGVVYGDTSLILGIKKISNEVPASYKLYQNYPNPFNPATKIRFSIPNSLFEGGWGDDMRDDHVNLVIYNKLGKEVTTLVNKSLNPGEYEVEWDASDYPSGIYFYRLIAGEFSYSKKMVLIK